MATPSATSFRSPLLHLALIVLGLGAPSLVAPPLHAGKLDRARDEVRGDDDADTHRSHHSDSDDGDDDDGYDDGDGDDFGALLAFYIVSLPWRLPHVLIEPDAPYDFRFADYPFARGSDGALFIEAPMAGDWPGGAQRAAARLSLDGSYQWDGIYRATVAARLQTPSRFELETLWSGYGEPLPGGELDTLTFGATNLSVRFAQGPNAQFRTGLGVRHIIDRQGAEFGFDFLYGFDLFIADPVVASVDFHLGGVGHAFVSQVRVTLGMMLGASEVFVGYDQLNVDSVSLGGVMLGTRLWL